MKQKKSKHNPIQIFSRFIKETPEAMRLIGLRRLDNHLINEHREGKRSIRSFVTDAMYDLCRRSSFPTYTPYLVNRLWMEYLRKNGYYDRLFIDSKDVRNNHFILCRNKKSSTTRN